MAEKKISRKQHRKLLIDYNIFFYKGIKDVSLKSIKWNVDKYLDSL